MQTEKKRKTDGQRTQTEGKRVYVNINVLC